jgi:hypothetical protein
MCDVGLAAYAIGGLLAAYGTYESGQQQKEWGDYQQKQANADANAERDAAEVRADNIRKVARMKASSANAAMAAMGIQTGEGTALEINKDIYASAENDAQLEIFGGKDSFARRSAEGEAFKIQGNQAAQAANIQAGSTLMMTAANTYGDWKTMNGNDGGGSGSVSYRPVNGGIRY